MIMGEKIPSQKERIVFQPSFYKGRAVKLQGCTALKITVGGCAFWGPSLLFAKPSQNSPPSRLEYWKRHSRFLDCQHYAKIFKVHMYNIYLCIL